MSDHFEIIKGKEPYIVLLHGYSSSKHEVLRWWRMYFPDYENGIIAMDRIGHNGRQGDMKDIFSSLDEINLMLKKFKKSVVIMGFSFGALESILVSPNKNVCQVFAVAAPYDFTFIEDKYQTKTRAAALWIAEHFKANRKFTEKDLERFKRVPSRIKKLSKKSRSKIYLIHARNDFLVPFLQHKRMQRDLRIPKSRVQLVNGKTHIGSIYNNTTIKFIKKNLKTC